MADQLSPATEAELRAQIRRKLREEGYLTLAEVAQWYRTTDGTVRYWRHTGYGPKGVKLGTRVLYPVAEIVRFDRQLAGQSAAAPALA